MLPLNIKNDSHAKGRACRMQICIFGEDPSGCGKAGIDG